MEQVLQILSTETKEGVGKKSGQAYKMVVAQCVLTDTQTGEIKVGELTLPKDVADPKPGHYKATFKIGVDFQTKKIGGILAGLEPVQARPASPAPSPASATAGRS